MFTLSIIFALCLKLSAGLKNDGDKEVEEPHLLDIIKNTASDVHNTIQHSKQPLKDLQECLFFVYFLFIYSLTCAVPFDKCFVAGQIHPKPGEIRRRNVGWLLRSICCEDSYIECRQGRFLFFGDKEIPLIDERYSVEFRGKHSLKRVPCRFVQLAWLS